MRTKTEMELMSLRQRYRDYLTFLRALPVTPLAEYRRVLIRFMACETILLDYRLNQKHKDIA